jgi:hypothetical protein
VEGHKSINERADAGVFEGMRTSGGVFLSWRIVPVEARPVVGSGRIENG